MPAGCASGSGQMRASAAGWLQHHHSWCVVQVPTRASCSAASWHGVVLLSSLNATLCPAGARIEREFCMIMAVAGDTLLALHHHLHGQRLLRPGALDLLWTVSCCCSKCFSCSQPRTIWCLAECLTSVSAA